jgi:hypothetical protein
MNIEISDPSQLSSLLCFLREHGCIAYVLEDVSLIEVVRPHSFGRSGDNELKALAAQWSAEHPEVPLLYPV